MDGCSKLIPHPLSYVLDYFTTLNIRRAFELSYHDSHDEWNLEIC